MLKHAMNKQKGMTKIGLIIMIAIVGFNALVAINVGPVYFTDANVTTLWKKLETDPTLVGMTRKNLRKAVSKRLKVNNVYDIAITDIEVVKEKDFYVVSIEYEPRGKLVGSLDYIMTFSHEARVRLK